MQKNKLVRWFEFSLDDIPASVKDGDFVRLDWDGTKVRAYVNGKRVRVRANSLRRSTPSSPSTRNRESG